jgi:uncharacterized protein YbcI
VDTVPKFSDLVLRATLTPVEKMVLAAVELLSVTAEHRTSTIEQVYARIAAGADVEIR